MMQGLIIGIVGTTIGGAAGCALATVFDRYQLIRVPIDVYQVSHLPFTVLPQDFVSWSSSARRRLLPRDDLSLAPGRPARSAQALRYE